MRPRTGRESAARCRRDRRLACCPARRDSIRRDTSSRGGLGMTHATVDLLLPMFADALEMLALTRASFHRYDPGPAETAIGLGRSIHKRERELTEQLIAAPPEIDGFRFVPSHLERISDAVQGLLRCVRTMDSEGDGLHRGRSPGDRAALRSERRDARVRAGPRPDGEPRARPSRRDREHALSRPRLGIRPRPRGTARRGRLPADRVERLPVDGRLPARGDPALAAHLRARRPSGAHRAVRRSARCRRGEPHGVSADRDHRARATGCPVTSFDWRGGGSSRTLRAMVFGTAVTVRARRPGEGVGGLRS